MRRFAAPSESASVAHLIRRDILGCGGRRKYGGVDEGHGLLRRPCRCPRPVRQTFAPRARPRGHRLSDSLEREGSLQPDRRGVRGSDRAACVFARTKALRRSSRTAYGAAAARTHAQRPQILSRHGTVCEQPDLLLRRGPVRLQRSAGVHDRRVVGLRVGLPGQRLPAAQRPLYDTAAFRERRRRRHRESHVRRRPNHNVRADQRTLEVRGPRNLGGAAARAHALHQSLRHQDDPFKFRGCRRVARASALGARLHGLLPHAVQAVGPGQLHLVQRGARHRRP